MKILNRIIFAVLLILVWFLIYLIPEFESVQVDPMGDGQSGIGKAVMGLMILGTGIFAVFIFITLLFIRSKHESNLSLINLITSLIVSVFSIGYIFIK